MRCRTRTLMCFWFSYIVFMSHAWIFLRTLELDIVPAKPQHPLRVTSNNNWPTGATVSWKPSSVSPAMCYSSLLLLFFYQYILFFFFQSSVVLLLSVFCCSPFNSLLSFFFYQYSVVLLLTVFCHSSFLNLLLFFCCQSSVFILFTVFCQSSFFSLLSFIYFLPSLLFNLKKKFF